MDVRPNFRGVGQSSGSHDFGESATSDLNWVLEYYRSKLPSVPTVLVEFSFSAFVIAKLAALLQKLDISVQSVVLAAMPTGAVEGGRVRYPRL